MKLLANENLPLAAVEALRQDGHDISWVRAECPGSSDDAVLDLAFHEARILLTLDKDFGSLALTRGDRACHGVILIRVPVMPAPDLARFVSAILRSREDWAGNFSVIELGRIRMRRLPQVG